LTPEKTFIRDLYDVAWNYNDNGTLVNITISDNDTYTWSWKLLRDVINYGVWKVFGQVDIVGRDEFYLLDSLI
jgi:hypothetical protein